MDTEQFGQSKKHLEAIGFRHDYGYNFKRGNVSLQFEDGRWFGWKSDGSVVWDNDHLPTH